MEEIDDDEAILNKVLLKFASAPEDVWLVDDAFRGTSIIGGTGSGKTTASGKKLAMTFLNERWGGLVLCAKTDEAELWEKYCIKAGRQKDLIIFGNGAIHQSGDHKGEKIVFNPLDYEMTRSGEGAGQTQNLTNIFMNIYKMGNRIAGEGVGKEDRFWDTALKRCLNRTIELIKLAKEDLSYSNMVRIISSSDIVTKQSVKEVIEDLNENGEVAELETDAYYCMKCLIDARAYTFQDKSLLTDAAANAYYLVDDYFTNVLPSLDTKTKAIISESFMGLAEPFMSGLLFEHFSGKTNIYPESTYLEKKIIILDFSIKEFLDVGIIAQSLFKLLFQQAIERRKKKDHPNPVFLWCDEAQYFINHYDQIFLTTARSSRAATVFLTQNISNYLAILGAGNDGKAKVDSLMGNLCTKIFHANTDAVTNEYASRLIGNAITAVATVGQSQTTFGIQNTSSESIAAQYLPQIQPREFTTLKNGGEKLNKWEVQGILQISGREWSNKKNHLRVSFIQDFK